MDENKLNKLRDIKYSINECCGMCVNGNFFNGNWGTCKKHSYAHKKHIGGSKSDIRDLSVYSHGHCKDFEMFDQIEFDTAHYKEFYE